MDDIQRIADEGVVLLSDPEVPREKMLQALASLMQENHAHLVTLGVSHPSLEKIREVTASFGLSTKLTGAGGGGCAVTLVPDGVLSLLDSLYGVWSRRTKADGGLGFASDDIERVVSKLTEAGFVPYLTTIGGSGLGMRNCSGNMGAIGDEFSCKESEELGQWAESIQGWTYV
jgi:mevalonate kinase